MKSFDVGIDKGDVLEEHRPGFPSSMKRDSLALASAEVGGTPASYPCRQKASTEVHGVPV